MALRMRMRRSMKDHHRLKGGEVRMKNRLGSRRGQSILEYLVIATIIVGAVIAVAANAIKPNMTTLYNNAGTRTGDAAKSLKDLKTE